MHRSSSIAISTGLIVSGVVACVLTAPMLVKNPDLAAPLNPMGINGSPYGEVFAMAMQSPIDDYFHAGTNGSIHSHAPGESCDHEVHKEHIHDEHCDHEHAKNLLSPEKPDVSPTLKSRFRSLLVSLSKVRAVRTNPRPASEAFKRHLRRQAEDKLRFAYRLDPSHYANYNALHFFLTEPEIGTRPELTPSAASLAQETITYCLKKTDVPRPTLTAAAACTNILHLMFSDRSSGGTRHSTSDMRKILGLLDYSITRYQAIAHEWETSGQWKALSAQRTQECLERYDFILKIRNAAETTIIQFEGPPTTSQENN
jgi:hypothetical protein